MQEEKNDFRESEIANQAFQELYSTSPENHNIRFIVEYGRLKFYNSYAILRKEGSLRIVTFKLSNRWKYINETIKKGLIQSLLIKLFSKELGKRRTTSMDLYDNFIKNLHLSINKNETDKKLEQSFNRINEKYFNNLVEKPNLRFGRASFRKLASYDFHTDRITVSSIFKEADDDLIDFLIYHETLHKIIKFKGQFKRVFHTRRFRRMEKEFENYKITAEKLRKYVRKAQLKHLAKNILKNKKF